MIDGKTKKGRAQRAAVGEIQHHLVEALMLVNEWLSVAPGDATVRKDVVELVRGILIAESASFRLLDRVGVTFNSKEEAAAFLRYLEEMI